MSDNAARECIKGSMLVRHLDEVDLANVFFKMRKVKGYTSKCKSRRMTRCTFSISLLPEYTHTREYQALCD